MTRAGDLDRLADRLEPVLAEQVAGGAVPGALAVVADAERARAVSAGTARVGADEPFRADTPIRISSIAKPIAAVATLALVEAGAVALDEPVDRLLPELADRRVLRRVDGPLDDTVPAIRPITVRDLLTCRMGFGFATVGGPAPVVEAAERLGLALGPPTERTALGPDEWLARFAALPLMHQPGDGWAYSTSFAVLGVLLARAGGAPLGDVLRERVFAPAGMASAGFTHLALADQWGAGPDGALAVVDRGRGGRWSRPPAFPSVEGGLVATADDVVAFGRLLLAGGTLGGRRVVGPAAVAEMTTDQLTADQRAAGAPFLDGRGWGLGLAVPPAGDDGGDRSDGGAGDGLAPGVPRGYGWDGGLGTSWANDPDRGLVAVLVTQVLPPSAGLYTAFWEAVAAA